MVSLSCKGHVERINGQGRLGCSSSLAPLSSPSVPNLPPLFLVFPPLLLSPFLLSSTLSLFSSLRLPPFLLFPGQENTF